MSLIHLSDPEFITVMERNASAQIPWYAANPDDVLRLVALLKAAQARGADLEIEILRLKATVACCGDAYDDNECEKAVATYEQASGQDYWQRRIEEIS